MTTKYAGIFDAGSSGTRLYIYRWKPWKVGDPAAPVIDPVLDEKVGEGIDKLWDESDTPQQRKSKVKEYLKALLALAKAFAAGAQVDLKDLPIYLMGTAGLRDFKAKADDGNTAHPTVQEYDGFIATITACIKEEKFTQVSYCGIITGEFEAIYGWVAANYTLGAFSGNPDTVGYLEMGGASAQIAFRPHKNLEESKPYYQGEVTHVRVGTSDFYLYVKSYALGANKAWEHRDRLLRQAAGNSRTIMDCTRPYGFQEEQGSPPITFKGPPWTRPSLRLKIMREAARDVLNELKGNARTSIPLLLDNDTLAEAVKNHHFVGGAGFWRTTRTLFGLDHEGKIKDAPFKYADFRQELLDTVDLTWDTLVGQRMIDKGHDKKYLERAWFSAQWIDCVLIDGFGLPLKGTRTVEEEKAAAVAAAKVNKAIEKKVAKRMLAFKMKLVEKRDNKSAMWNGGEVVGDGVVVEDEGVVGDGDVDLDDEDFDSNGSASEDEEPSPLHEEVELSFQPYNGPKGAELSWTLGRVVLLATGDDAPETMTGDAAIDTMSARTTSLRRDALATDLRGKSKDLGYRRDSYLKRAAEVKRDFDKFKFKLLAQICDAQSAHYEGEADRVLGGSKCVPPRKVPGDALLL